MPQKIMKWFYSPQFPDDEDKTRIAGMLHIILLVFLSVIIVAIVLGVTRSVSVTNRAFFNLSVVIAPSSIITMLVLLHKGYVSFVAWIFVFFQWLSTVIQVLGSGGIASPAISAFIATLLLAGFLISGRAIAVFAVLSMLAILRVWQLESLGQLPPPLVFGSPQAKVFFFMTLMIVIAALLNMVMRALNHSLIRSRAYARELEQVIQQKDQAETALRQSSERLEILHKIGHAITELRDLESVLEIILQQVLQVLPLDTLFITLYDPETQTTSFPLFYEGGKRWNEPNSKLKPGSNISRVIQTGESILRLVTAEELEYSQKHPQILLGDRSQVSASFIYVPLLNKGTVIGLISVQSYALNLYTETTLRLLEGVAPQAAIAIENARLYANLQNELTERLRIEAEREQLIQQLEANNAELERFTYTVSHDLRNPLVTIKGFLGMLDKDMRENRPDRIQNDFQRIAGATEKMDALLTDLLELSRIGRIVNPPMEIDTVRLIQDALDNLDGRLRPRNITMKMASDIPNLYGDRTRLREVFENLIENAVKYIGEQTDPLIEIGTRQDKNGQIIFVKDNGIGIEERYHTRIFALFEKLNPNIEGTGIGLALVKRIIEVHGGKIWVESKGLGEGSMFCFTIPNSRNEMVRE